MWMTMAKDSLFLFSCSQNLDQHAKYVRHTVIPDVHPELIRQVKYLPENNLIITSCANPNKSIVISDIRSLKKNYVFKIDKVCMFFFTF